ncbi:Sec-independent protein translocase protein TatB [Altererythrobacter aquiaggeris]|uniref:Sec-independent protein translocase protein TatB n=1 Tax=Aestuarierythrobacter aquiaggeris TaxID=1898396 RepID=UPI00301AD985
MFDIGASELLLLVVVAVLVIGPKDMPLALRTAGKWMGKIRRVSGHFRAGIDTMIREAEMEEHEQKWKERNAKIMAQTPAGEMGPLPDDVWDPEPSASTGAEGAVVPQEDGQADLHESDDRQSRAGNADEPPLPFGKPD